MNGKLEDFSFFPSSDQGGFLDAINWWQSLDIEQQTEIEKKYGHCCPDIRTTLDDIHYFYKQEHND